MYKNIMVTLDCSKVDKYIVEHVLKLAAILKSTVHLLHVVHSHTMDQHRDLHEKAQRCIEKHKQAFVKAGIKVREVIISGEPEQEIIKELKTGKYDLVAMATHGHKVILDFMLGSVSRRLKHASTVPLLLVKSS